MKLSLWDRIVKVYCGTEPRLRFSIALGVIAKMMCPEHGLIVAHACDGKCDLVFKVKRKAN